MAKPIISDLSLRTRFSVSDKYHSYLPAERQQRIIEILKKNFPTRSSNLSELLGVISELETVNMTAELVLLPGTYNPTTHALVGPLTMEMIRQVNTTKAFIWGWSQPQSRCKYTVPCNSRHRKKYDSADMG